MTWVKLNPGGQVVVLEGPRSTPLDKLRPAKDQEIPDRVKGLTLYCRLRHLTILDAQEAGHAA